MALSPQDQYPPDVNPLRQEAEVQLAKKRNCSQAGVIIQVAVCPVWAWDLSEIWRSPHRRARLERENRIRVNQERTADATQHNAPPVLREYERLAVSQDALPRSVATRNRRSAAPTKN